MARHEHSAAGRGLGERTKGNYGREHKGSKSPFAGASPMETSAPGERWNNRPKGPSLRGGEQAQSGGGTPAETVDRVSRGDVAKHTGRD